LRSPRTSSTTPADQPRQLNRRLAFAAPLARDTKRWCRSATRSKNVTVNDDGDIAIDRNPTVLQ
jgi:hypothetical protein